MKKKKRLLFIFLFVFMLLSYFKSPTISHALDSSTTSSVVDNEITTALEDLKKDSDFNLENYPAVINDYSIKVIQIAETSSNELFIYTYQPSNTLRSCLIATSISMSVSIGESLDYHVYTLKLINWDITFNKYVVNGFKVKSDEIRYYDISTIYRSFNENIDNPINLVIETNEVGFKVGQLWSAKTINGELNYCMVENETITITDKFVGFIRYFDGFKLNNWYILAENTDSHFIAFSTDRIIDTLEEVQISYVVQDYYSKLDVANPQSSYTYLGDEVLRNETIRADQSVESTSDNWLASTYKWGRIQTKSEFLISDGDSLNDEVKTELNNKEFIVRFYESPFNLTATTESSIRVSNVVILRLKFKTAGIVYNLGVVDSKQTGSQVPVGVDLGGLDDLGNTLKYIFMILALVVLLVIVMPFVPTILNAIMKVVKTIFKVITYPFKVLIDLFNKGKDKK